MTAHTHQFLVSITTEKELQPEDIAVALTGTGNAAADPRHDRVTVMWAHPETQPKVAPPFPRGASHLTINYCAACRHYHPDGTGCLAGQG